MEKLSVQDLKEICARAWSVPVGEVSLLLNPQSTEVVHTHGTEVRLLVSKKHSAFVGTPDPAQIIAEGALKELEESIPLRRGAAKDLRSKLAAQQHRVADGIAQRDRLRALLGLPAGDADGPGPSDAPKRSPGDKNCDCQACLMRMPSAPPEGLLWEQTTAGSDLTGRRVVVDVAEISRVVAEAVDLERKAIALLLGDCAASLPEDLRPALAAAVEMVQQRVGRRAVSVPYQPKVGES